MYIYVCVYVYLSIYLYNIIKLYMERRREKDIPGSVSSASARHFIGIAADPQEKAVAVVWAENAVALPRKNGGLMWLKGAQPW